MDFLKVLFAFAVPIAASTLVAKIISGTVFGTVNWVPLFVGMAGRFVVALNMTKAIRSSQTTS